MAQLKQFLLRIIAALACMIALMAPVHSQQLFPTTFLSRKLSAVGRGRERRPEIRIRDEEVRIRDPRGTAERSRDGRDDSDGRRTRGERGDGERVRGERSDRPADPVRVRNPEVRKRDPRDPRREAPRFREEDRARGPRDPRDPREEDRARGPRDPRGPRGPREEDRSRGPRDPRRPREGDRSRGPRGGDARVTEEDSYRDFRDADVYAITEAAVPSGEYGEEYPGEYGTYGGDDVAPDAWDFDDDDIELEPGVEELSMAGGALPDERERVRDRTRDPRGPREQDRERERDRTRGDRDPRDPRAEDRNRDPRDPRGVRTRTRDDRRPRTTNRRPRGERAEDPPRVRRGRGE